MALKVKFDQEKLDQKNITPLGNDEIKSILKTQSDAIFQDKNITNNSNFVKKSLIDIALDFESKEINNENTENAEKIKENIEPKNIENIQEKSNEDVNQTDKSDTDITSNEIDKLSEQILSEPELVNQTDKSDRDITSNETDKLSDQSLSESELVNQNDDEHNTSLNELNTENYQSENITQTNIEIEKANNQNQDQINENKIITEPNTKTDETKQALESVRDAVSQSMNKSDSVEGEKSNGNKEPRGEISEIFQNDFNEFKNIFSSLSNLGEEAIYETIKSKIIDIAYDLAGYQIDKMPEKYEKKIRSLLKNINCFEDKIKIEVNEQDYDALSKIENFFDNQDKSIFVSNQDLSRGDIILNCDGMHYSEKSNKI